MTRPVRSIALYWDFLVRHHDRFEANPRMKMMYRNVDRKGDEDIERIQERKMDSRFD